MLWKCEIECKKLLSLKITRTWLSSHLETANIVQCWNKKRNAMRQNFVIKNLVKCAEEIFFPHYEDIITWCMLSYCPFSRAISLPKRQREKSDISLIIWYIHCVPLLYYMLLRKRRRFLFPELESSFFGFPSKKRKGTFPDRKWRESFPGN